MTLANKITIFRILLVPVFVLFMIYYSQPPHKEWHRWAAIIVFILASVSDGVDGYIARRFNQRTRLGTILDPLADKILLVTALVLLTVENDGFDLQLPKWFPLLIISREVLLVTGTFLLHMIGVRVEVRPRIVGKVATFLQMVTVAWVFLKIGSPLLFEFAVPWRENPIAVTLFHIPLVLAGLCTLISGLWYIVDGARQISSSQISH
jgi:CDP-diacylglycerol--glycerol-3-phosphate 3-phosphatidyltransferase